MTDAEFIRLEIKELEAKIEHAECDLANKREELRRAEKKCSHAWGPVVADHIRTPSYVIPGDPEGTMGVDRRFDTYVSATVKEQWKRTCKLCGKVEHTTKTRQTVTEEPRFD